MLGDEPVSCCGGPNAMAISQQVRATKRQMRGSEYSHYAHEVGDGLFEILFGSPEIHCGKCVALIEQALGAISGVHFVRVNLTMKRVALRFAPGDDTLAEIASTLEKLGYTPIPVDMGDAAFEAQRNHGRKLLRSLAVAGFAAANVMLLSVSIWSGAEGSTRDLFHLLSALIAVPAVFYSGQVFFSSALSALSNRMLNMDVPISLAVLLALAMSVFETVQGGEEAYFDASVTLLFFLLIGRYLDHRMRERARGAVSALQRLTPRSGLLLGSDGKTSPVPIDEIEPGMLLRVPVGERLPVDAEVIAGTSDLDRSLVTGEFDPVPARPSTMLEAGVLNLTGPLDVRALRVARNSYLAEVTRLLEAAEGARNRYVRIADRMASIYAPVVHLLSAIAFVVWMYLTGDWRLSLYVAISVLIVTCPCALGLAVPVVHVIGAARLFERGILLKDGSGLERLAEIDCAVFDKTGTLTMAIPTVARSPDLSDTNASIIKALASRSIHPASKAISDSIQVEATDGIRDIQEVPGYGMEAVWRDKAVRLGRPAWVAEIAEDTGTAPKTGISFAAEGERAIGFELAEQIRPKTAETLLELNAAGIRTEILSGDSAPAVLSVASRLGITNVTAGCRPQEKLARLQSLAKSERKVLMVGDGLNDAPSLAAAHVSMAPGSASDVGRMAADFVFTRPDFDAVSFAYKTAKTAARLVHQNFGLAILYNMIAVPAAMAGLISPLIAAIAMSASSIVVIGNSLRLAGTKDNLIQDRSIFRDERRDRRLGEPVRGGAG